MDKHRLVQQYVERQKAYIPTYTKEDPWNRCTGTPSKPTRCDDFGFDTPVLRPRVPVNKTSQSQQAGPSKRAREIEPGPPPEDAPLERQDPPDKPRPKRKKASTPANTVDDEQAARLADRRERKRKKRAIVDPPQKHDQDSASPAAPKKGRKNDQKAKKPAALALMYGFSATNVTKDRLTLKPAPSLGVFSKGKASVKKKVTATKKSSSKNEIFSESAFLNRPSERAADHSKVNDDSDSSASSVTNDPAPKATTRVKHGIKKGRYKSAETTAPKSASNRTTAESEVWDIELQSRLPSSARDVSSESGASDSAPIVVDLRKAEWSASLEQHAARTRSLSVTPGRPPARSDVHDEFGIPPAAPSLHPSHSASQVGCGAAAVDMQASESRQVTSKYFMKPVSAPQFAAATSSSNDNLEVRDPDQDDQEAAMGAGAILRVTSLTNSSVGVAHPAVELRTRSNVVPPSDGFEIRDGVRRAAMNAQAILRTASPIDSLISVAQPMAEFRTWSDVAPLEFSSDCPGYGDFYAPCDASSGPLSGQDHGYYFEPSAVDSQGVECLHAQQDAGWCSCADYDVEGDFMQSYAPLAPTQDEGSEAPVSGVELAEWDPGEAPPLESSWSREDLGVGDDEWAGEGAGEFSEGRALLLGVPEWAGQAGLSGLAQAEMDVANRLRDHWRRVRLS